MSDRIKVGSGAPWEPVVGYSRAVRVGNQVWVAGTTAADADGQSPDAMDAGAQTAAILAKIGAALERVGATLADVVRTRIYVTDIGDWEAVGRAHGAVFGAIRPACTLVEVSRLIAPQFRVEIEADAVVPDEAGR
jgi:enamine deaminase RidA (YjgF/YER057c/UK114 family)